MILWPEDVVHVWSVRDFYNLDHTLASTSLAISAIVVYIQTLKSKMCRTECSVRETNRRVWTNRIMLLIKLICFMPNHVIAVEIQLVGLSFHKSLYFPHSFRVVQCCVRTLKVEYLHGLDSM